MIYIKKHLTFIIIVLTFPLWYIFLEYLNLDNFQRTTISISLIVIIAIRRIKEKVFGLFDIVIISLVVITQICIIILPYISEIFF